MLSRSRAIDGVLTCTTVCGSAHTFFSVRIAGSVKIFESTCTITIHRDRRGVLLKLSAATVDTSNCGSLCGSPGISCCSTSLTTPLSLPTSSTSNSRPPDGGMSVGRSLHEASNMAVAQAMSNTDVQCVFFMTECLILCQRLYSLILPRTFRSVLSSPQAAKISSPRLARMVV